MIDIKFLRENPETVRENIKKKFQDSKLGLVDEVIGKGKKLRLKRQKWLQMQNALRNWKKKKKNWKKKLQR